MCYNAILPTALRADQFDTDIANLTYIFNRWLKMLTNYGKLDEMGLSDDFTMISKVIKSNGIKKDVRRAVLRCRDYALVGIDRINDLKRCLGTALEALCRTQESKDVKKVKQSYADQGMIERYRPLTKRLAREKIHKIGRSLIFTDRHTDDKETTKLVRRIVEKRAAQTVHKNTGQHDRETNRFRQAVRRATSFSLYNKKYTDYDAQLRIHGTHWKVVRHTRKAKKILTAKISYKTYGEAVEACERYRMNHPDDTRPISAYKCCHCGKWHIGHDHYSDTGEEWNDDFQSPIDKHLRSREGADSVDNHREIGEIQEAS